MEMNGRHEAIYAILRQFALAHTYVCVSDVRFDDFRSSNEIDLIVERIENIQKANQIADRLAEEEHAKDTTRTLLRNLDIGPLLAGTFYARYLRAIEEALKKSAEADIVRAIIDCERFLVEVPDELDRGNRIIEYMERLRELWASLSEEPDKEDGKTEEES